MKNLKNKFKNQKGSTILWAMMFMMLFLLIVSTVTSITILEIRQSTKIDSSTVAYLVAQAGAERAKNYTNVTALPTGGATASPSGQIDGKMYTVKVVHATGSDVSGYDGASSCVALDTDGVSGLSTSDSNYCYYSQATVGSIRRKIEGKRSDISTDQGTNFSSSSDSSPINIPIAQVPGGMNYVLSGTIKDTDAPFSNYSLGLSDGTSKIQTKIVEKNIGIYDQNGTQIGSSVDISGLDSVLFELTYRTKDSPSVTLKIQRTDDESCLGIITSGFAQTFTPTKLEFEGTMTNGIISTSDGITVMPFFRYY